MSYRLDLILWLSGLGFCLGLEIFGLVYDRNFTLTGIIRHYVPTWVLAGIWGWLGYHFLIAGRR